MSINEMNNLLSEVEENAELLESTGTGIIQTIVCTLGQHFFGCLGSYVLGNKGFTCTVTSECQSTCN